MKDVILKDAIQLKDQIKDLEELEIMYHNLPTTNSWTILQSKEVQKLRYKKECLQSDLKSLMEYLGGLA